MSRWNKKTLLDIAMNASTDKSQAQVSAADSSVPADASSAPATLPVNDTSTPTPDSLLPGTSTTSASTVKKENSLLFRVAAQNGNVMHADTVVVWRKDTDESVYHSSQESLPLLCASNSETPKEVPAPSTPQSKSDSCHSEGNSDTDVTMVTLTLPIDEGLSAFCDDSVEANSRANRYVDDDICSEADENSSSSVKSKSPDGALWSDSGLGGHAQPDDDDTWFAASDSNADNPDVTSDNLESSGDLTKSSTEKQDASLSEQGKDFNKSWNSGKDSSSGGSGFGAVHYSSNGEVNLSTPKTQTPHCKSSEKKKKANWYNVLSPTYKSRSEDFKKIFKDLPSDERLIVDYSCALQKDILVHGRLYVTQNWICFYANIFRWETVLTIRCKDIVAMTKEKTARVIPNALQIQTETEKYFFTSFGAREKTFLMLFRVWQNALMDQPMAAQELWQWVHYYYGDELGLTSSDEDYVPTSAEELKIIIENETGAAEDENSKDKADLSDGVPNGQVGHHLSAPSSLQGLDSLARDPSLRDSAARSSPERRESSHRSSSEYRDSVPRSSPEHNDVRPDVKVSSPNQLQLPSPGVTGTDVLTDQGDTTEDSEGEVAPFDPPDIPMNGTTYMEEDFDIPVDQLFDWCFTDSKSFRLYHNNRKTTEMRMTPWVDEGDGNRTRELNYVLVLNQSFGPKSSPCLEKQTYNKHSISGKIYIVDTDCIMNHIPYGESFYVMNRYWLTKKSRHRSHMRIASEVKYRKSVWGPIRSIIEKNVSSGLRESYSAYAKHLHRECEKFADIVAGPDVVAGQPIKKKVLRRRRTQSHNMTGERLPSSKRSTDSAQSSVQGTPVKGALHRTSVDMGASGYGTDLLARIVCALLLLLVMFNAVLFYKLSSLETKANLHVSQQAHQRPPFDNMACPSSQAEWHNLLKQQQKLHESEISRWQDILTSSVTLIDEMKKALVELKNSIDTRMNELRSENNT